MTSKIDSDLEAHLRLHTGLMMADFFAPTPGRGVLLHLMGKTEEEVEHQIDAECALASRIAKDVIRDYKQHVRTQAAKTEE